MRTKGVNKEQQLKYILECRNSGLTDYQWCQEHDDSEDDKTIKDTAE